MSFRIGQLAREADVNLETIRYYERRGLIEQPKKPSVGYRLYSRNDLQRLLFIKRAKTLGFSLDETQNLLALSEGHCAEVQIMAQQKLNQIQAKVTDLLQLEVVLQKLVNQCDGSSGKPNCPIIDTLLNEK